MPSTTRTLNPLPFGDLEPKRFEDLVRQLAYEFKNWRRLEATGRSGGDDGFDARGYEIVAKYFTDPESEKDESEIDSDDADSDRLWLVQCKREKAIGPAKLRGYLEEISLKPDEQLFGIVFSAACDFSKKTRNELVAWCHKNHVSEWHIWGRGELEDMLFQPRFDNLLFAYFGISLTIRRRGLTTELRRQIAIKRRLKRFLDAKNDGLVLLRDIDDSDYPNVPQNGLQPRFRVRRADSLSPYGLAIKVSMRQAWLAGDGKNWDVALASLGNSYSSHADLWNLPSDAEEQISAMAAETWQQLPNDEKAWLYVEGVIPYESIVLIDDIGDSEFSGPHIYVTGWDIGYPYSRTYIETIDIQRRTKFDLDPISNDRVAKFPAETREFKRKKLGY